MTVIDADADVLPLRRELRAARKRRQRVRTIRDGIIFIVAAALVSVLLQMFVIRSFYIPSESMLPTLQLQDRILVDELTPHFTGYHRNDIVVFRDPDHWLSSDLSATSDDLVKRVVGLPGDRVQGLADGTVKLDGSLINEPWAQLAPQTPFDVTVPSGQLWVMGDNRGNSADSRFHGTVPIADVIGRGFWVWWPASSFRFI